MLNIPQEVNLSYLIDFPNNSRIPRYLFLDFFSLWFIFGLMLSSVEKPYEIGPNHTSILKFVKSYVGKKKVPTLCDDPNLAPYGACRVCSVEVALEKDGPTKVVASCHTPVAENQHIFTTNDALTSLRKNIVELVLTDHPMAHPPTHPHTQSHTQPPKTPHTHTP